MNYKNLAKEILINIGGESNVKSYTHCATRLRFNLNDESKFDQDVLKKINGVMGTVISGGQFQVIIGTDVSHVFDELKVLLPDNRMDEISKEVIDEDKSRFSKVLDTISGIFTPILPAITGAAMIKVLIILLTMSGLLQKDTQTYQILTFVGDTPFYFLPIMLSYTAAVKFKMNPMMGMLLGLMLIHPTYTNMVAAGEGVKLFGFLPVTLATYTSTVIPVILIVWIASYVERFADKVSPKAVRFFLKPLITLLVMIPLAFCAVGPIGTIVGTWLESVLNVIQTQAPWSLPIIFGILSPIVIMFGMHYVVTIPLVMTAISANGFDMIGPGFLVANMGQAGAALAIALIAKNVDFKAMAASSGITALLGVTEPAMYGVNLKLKKPFIAALIGGGIGGLICGIAGVKRIVFGPTGLTTIPIFIDPNNSMNIVFAVIGVVVSFIIAFGVTYYLAKKDKKIMNEIGE
ncbi:MAG: PTS transporter subunit EIIC [Clostridium sp.]|uniref:PTS transporter subunit EIIC n=1 Tax=Clostridium sp. TaxID=1506 RepID=UPI00290ABC5B|nr:PTS transporter subunit EIIC [Clostridium sp.]MDU5110368.1 PTS transporter subunit EIIC [Clostridium sp.]